MELLFNAFKNHKDFVMLAVSQDHMGRDMSPHMSRGTATISRSCSIPKTSCRKPTA